MKKLCSYPNCHEIIEDRTRCDKHKRKKDYRLSSNDRGYNSKWRKAASEYIEKHPICNNKGCDNKASVVDHIIPHQGNKQLFWDINNWQQLCSQCHNIKSAIERWERI